LRKEQTIILTLVICANLLTRTLSANGIKRFSDDYRKAGRDGFGADNAVKTAKN
jgi:hypothetical protein